MSLFGQQVQLPSLPLVHKTFEAHAERHPDRVALTCGRQEHSYRDLNLRSNQFAYYLMEQGLGPGSVVGVCLDRSPEMIISILGILKAGAAYAPLDTTYPASRLQLMISQLAAMKLIVAGPRTLGMVGGSSTKVLDLAEAGPFLRTFPIADPVVEISGQSICYVVFTSGSTGTPKAVAVRHEGWCNLLSWAVSEFGLVASSSGLLMSPFGFDISQRALMTPLFTGSALHLLPSRNFDVMMTYRMIAELSVRTLHCAPSALYLLLERAGAVSTEALGSLAFVFVGGEPIAPARVTDWATRPGNPTRLVNVYGVAECTDVATAHVLVDYARYAASGVPIGSPIYNVNIHVLDSDLTPVPPGDTGEICISGVCVGAGYLNDSKLNDERFVSLGSGESLIGLYRTGDLGRVSPDGELMYVGRADGQVKIRGMRVDVGDVEAALAGNEHVRQAVVLPVRSEGSQAADLVGFVVPSGGVAEKDFDLSVVRRQLLTVLPAHMIPISLVAMPRFPLSPNGKVDRRALAVSVGESAQITDNKPGVQKAQRDISATAAGFGPTGIRQKGTMTMSVDQLPEPTARIAPTAVIKDDIKTDIEQFERDGFVGPIKVYEPDEASAMIREIRIQNQKRSNMLYQNSVNYDRHFDISLLSKHITNPVIVRYLRAILGPDILLWRTEFFPKFPGTPGTEWHQVRDYSYANGNPQLLPTQSEWNAFIDLTVWTAFTPATKRTGCMRFLRGSHRAWYFDERKATQSGRNSEYDVNKSGTSFFGYKFSDFLIDQEWQPPEEDVVDVEMKPGEAVIFSATCVHGSEPNTTERETRFAIAGRYVPTHVRVYPDQDGFTAHGASFDLANYGSVLVSGQNHFDHNRIRTTNNLGEPFSIYSAD
jgi:D-alanine--poly(phosphoribitol) ligase subunit 1